MTGTVIEQITRAIAKAEQIDPKEFDESLEDAVSTDAVRDLVAHESNSWRLQFETRNHVVEVMGDDTILIDGKREGDLFEQ